MLFKMKGKKLLMSLCLLMTSAVVAVAQGLENPSVGTVNLTLEKAIEIAL